MSTYVSRTVVPVADRAFHALETAMRAARSVPAGVSLWVWRELTYMIREDRAHGHIDRDPRHWQRDC